MFNDMKESRNRTNINDETGEWPEREGLSDHPYADDLESSDCQCGSAMNASAESASASEPTANKAVIRETTEGVVVHSVEVNETPVGNSNVQVNGPQESFDHNTGVSRKSVEVSKTEPLPGWLIDEAHGDVTKPAVGSAAAIQKVLTDPLVMPGTRREAERDIAYVGPEGMPADAKDGPTMLRLELIGLTVLLLGIALGVGVWFGWVYGAVIAGWAMLSLMFNPVVWATLSRAKDRSIAADMEHERRTVVKH